MSAGSATRRWGRSLEHQNYRRYLVSTWVSNTGMWVQQTAELWLIFQLTGSGKALALHSILRFTPVLLFGTYGGLLADRFDHRRLLVCTQAGHAVATAILAVATWHSSPTLPLIYSVVAAQGLINALDHPLRKTFVRDLVDDGALPSAVSMNATVGTLCRTIGPAVGGLLIASLDVAWCFTINAVSYWAVLAMLMVLDRSALRPNEPVAIERGQIRAGFRYAWRSRGIRTTLLFVVVVSVFGWNYGTLLPVYATEVLGGGAAFYGAMLTVLSIGSFIGATLTGRITSPKRRHIMITTGSVAAASFLLAVAPGITIAVVGLLLLGGGGTAFLIVAQTRIQLRADPMIAGRIIAIYSVCFSGSKPLGALIGGWLVDAGSARIAFGVGAATVTTILAATQLGRRHRRPGESPRPLADATTATASG